MAELHSQLLRDKVLADFSDLWPDRFTNVTNGVTPRRFIRQSNPALTGLISETIGKGWVANLDRLEELQGYADDPEFRAAFREVKALNKRRISEVLQARDGIVLPPVSYTHLDVYKRQL